MFLLVSSRLDSAASNFIHLLAVHGIDGDNRVDVIALRVRLALRQAGVRHADVQLGMHGQDPGVRVLDGFPQLRNRQSRDISYVIIEMRASMVIHIR